MREEQQTPRGARFCSAVFRAGFTAASAASRGTANCDRDPRGRWCCAFRPWEKRPQIFTCGFTNLIGFSTFYAGKESEILTLKLRFPLQGFYTT